MPISRLLIFLSIVTTVLFLVHFYIWRRVVHAAALPAPWGRALTIALFVLAALLPLVLLTMRSAPRWIGVPLGWLAYTWMGVMFYLFVFSLVGDVVRLGIFATGNYPQDPGRRWLLGRTVAAGIGASALLVSLAGFLNAAGGLRVRRVRVQLAKLPQGASGYVIAQLTDIHVGPTIGRAFVETIVRETNALNPDLIAITGDLVDGSVEQLGDLVGPLRGLKARDGVFFVTGNHEYYSGADAWIEYLGTLGIRVLRNERADIRGLFDLAGVDDLSAKGMLPGHGQDVPRAAEGRDPGKALVLLAHQPKAIGDAVEAGVDLQLSGHVHGGQIVPFNLLAKLEQPYVSGLHRRESTWIYVSEGTGYWGPPMRVGTRSEITRIELVSGEA